MSAVLEAEHPNPHRIALVGSPNTGKTTLFNALTGSRARVGNYPGVTVERRVGQLESSDSPVAIIDLPGTYSLRGETPDEQIAVKVIGGEIPGESIPDAILVVLDATTLRRGLGLVAQVLAFGLPTAVAVTMIDEVKARGGRVDLVKLSNLLGVPVVGVVGHRGVGLDSLEALLAKSDSWSIPTPKHGADAPTERFAWADQVCDQALVRELDPDTRTDAIDRVLLHPVGGLAFFLLVMLLLFQSIFTWAAPAMDAIDSGFNVLSHATKDLLPAGWLADLLTDGVLVGVGSVLIFLPQIVILFTLIHVLNAVGYMARAAFVVDRIMGWVGLQGRSFVPLLSCYACAVPGIMAARTIASPRERLATIAVAPFMTCSARLPVYKLLISAFVPRETVMGVLGLQGLVMLGLYLLGVTTALGSAALLNRSLLKGTKSVFYMELPPYRFPTAKHMAHQVWRSAYAFIRRAGTIILATSIVLWALLSYPKIAPDPAFNGAQQAQANIEASAAAHLGRAIEPIIEPLGFDWRIGVGLIASLAAREVIVSTLAQIYAVGDSEDFESLRGALMKEDPVTGEPALTLATALSLLVFFVFALQCVSTIVVMAKETGGWKWPAFAFGYMQALAWVGSFVTYRMAISFL